MIDNHHLLHQPMKILLLIHHQKFQLNHKITILTVCLIIKIIIYTKNLILFYLDVADMESPQALEATSITYQGQSQLEPTKNLSPGSIDTFDFQYDRLLFALLIEKILEINSIEDLGGGN